MYRHGMHMTSKVNDLYQVGQRVAAIALPHMDKYLPGVLNKGVQAIGNLDAMRGEAQSRFHDVQEQMADHGRVFEQIRHQIPHAHPYMN